MILSKQERRYLSRDFYHSPQYERVIRHRIKTKLKEFFMLELPLLQNVTEFSNVITEFSNKECDHRNFKPRLKATQATLNGNLGKNLGSLHSQDSADACGLAIVNSSTERYHQLSKEFQKYVSSLDWQEYNNWVSANKSKHYASFLRRESKKRVRFAFSNELARLPNDRKREDILKALTNLIRYVDIKYDTYFHDEFLAWLKRK